MKVWAVSGACATYKELINGDYVANIDADEFVKTDNANVLLRPFRGIWTIGERNLFTGQLFVTATSREAGPNKGAWKEQSGRRLVQASLSFAAITRHHTSDKVADKSRPAGAVHRRGVCGSRLRWRQ